MEKLQYKFIINFQPFIRIPKEGFLYYDICTPNCAFEGVKKYSYTTHYTEKYRVDDDVYFNIQAIIDDNNPNFIIVVQITCLIETEI